MNPLALFCRRPAEDLENGGPDLDTPTFERRSGEWRSGLRSVRARPLEWTPAEPPRPGFFHARLPGTKQFTIVQVAHDERGVLVYGMPKVDWKPVVGSELEWGSCRIQDPC